MTKQQAEQFISIYNALLTIPTKGDATKTMAKVLEMMEELANSIKLIDEPTMPAPVVEETNVKGE